MFEHRQWHKQHPMVTKQVPKLPRIGLSACFCTDSLIGLTTHVMGSAEKVFQYFKVEW